MSYLKEGIDSFSSVGAAAYPDFLKHEIEVGPAATPTVRTKHGMGTQNVHLHRM